MQSYDICHMQSHDRCTAKPKTLDNAVLMTLFQTPSVQLMKQATIVWPHLLRKSWQWQKLMCELYKIQIKRLELNLIQEALLQQTDRTKPGVSQNLNWRITVITSWYVYTECSRRKYFLEVPKFPYYSVYKGSLESMPKTSTFCPVISIQYPLVTVRRMDGQTDDDDYIYHSK